MVRVSARRAAAHLPAILNRNSNVAKPVFVFAKPVYISRAARLACSHKCMCSVVSRCGRAATLLSLHNPVARAARSAGALTGHFTGRGRGDRPNFEPRAQRYIGLASYTCERSGALSELFQPRAHARLTAYWFDKTAFRLHCANPYGSLRNAFTGRATEQGAQFEFPAARARVCYLTDDIRLPFSLGEKRKLRVARGCYWFNKVKCNLFI